MRTLGNREDLGALLVGLGIFGTGGGGDPQGWGRSIFEADLAAGREYTLVSPSDLPDDAFVLSGGYLGSVEEDSALDSVVDRWDTNFELESAIRSAEREHGRRADALVPFELGGGNTPVILSCAARRGIPVVDGDGVGRAAPETHMSSFLGHGISLTPMPLVGGDGTELVVRSGDILLPDGVGRYLAARNGGLLANAHYGMSGQDLKRSVVPNSITRSLQLGCFVSNQEKRGEPGLDAICDFLKGIPLFHGLVDSLETVPAEAFYATRVTLTGVGRDRGHTLELVVKNEVMCAKLDGRPVVVFPDLVLLLEPSSLHGIMSPKLQPQQEILTAALPCHPVLRRAMSSKEGAAAFSSARYGEELEYHPVEQLLA